MLNLFVIIAKREIYEIDFRASVHELFDHPSYMYFILMEVLNMKVFQSGLPIRPHFVTCLTTYMYKYAPSALQNTMGM